MNCTDINTFKDDYLDGQLPSLQKAVFEQHLIECKNCNETVNASQQILDVMGTLTAPEPADDFVEKMFKEVRKQYPEKSSHHFVAGFATAMAAGFALWFISTIFEVQQQSLPASNEMMISLNTERSVRLMFDAPDNIKQVTLSIKLPDNIELSGFAGQSELSWQTSFTKGPNILTLPIKAVDQGAGELIARLNYGDKLKEFHLVIKTAEDGVVNYQLKPFTSV
ncbi:MAG: hypothetical protein DIZ80_16940 [endosymbiont of Galathealinum brachiosum]|uniref:Putative zinc-finger domain-containing protein n=1 Tax=endosymbiont of Galathealinum brachiosum TaxID=2200906 RepID=A0A370D6R6_9GAMM|nr:MAG: hypothetical protein DIZ80_16940 [endosymbiont of Galathealinum brachiosum]